MPQTCSTFAAYICGAFAANAFFVCKLLFWRTVLAHNVRRKYAVHSCGALFWQRKFAAHSCRTLYWHIMCAERMQRTVVAHYSGTQCVPQVCSALLSHTILVCLNFAAHSCRALRCSAPPLPQPPTPPLVYHPHCHIFFSSLPPGGV